MCVFLLRLFFLPRSSCRDLQGYRVTRFTSQTDAVVTSFGGIFLFTLFFSSLQGPKEFAIFFNLINVALHEEPDFQMLPLMGSENRNFEVFTSFMKRLFVDVLLGSVGWHYYLQIYKQSETRFNRYASH